MQSSDDPGMVSEEAIEEVRHAFELVRLQLATLEEYLCLLDRAVTRQRRAHARLLRRQQSEYLAKIAARLG